MQSNTPTRHTLLLTPQQAAKALAISQRKLWGMTAAGEIPCIRLGRCKRYRVEALQEFLESQEKGGDRHG
jgi:excisionase family DNA binding protein